MYDSISIDNGFSWWSTGPFTVKDSKIYGEMKDNVECYPYGKKCSCPAITGVTLQATFIDSDVIGFSNYKQGCGGRQAVVSVSAKSYNNEIPFLKMNNMLFTDLDFSAFTYFSNAAHCGDFRCTGYFNGMMLVTRSRYRGTIQPTGLPGTFMVVSENKLSTSTQVFPGCRFIKSWNARLCIEEKIGKLVFESFDRDK